MSGVEVNADLAESLKANAESIHARWCQSLGLLRPDPTCPGDKEDIPVWARSVLDGVIDALRTGSTRSLEFSLRRKPGSRASAPLPVHEVVEGLLLLPDAASPFLDTRSSRLESVVRTAAGWYATVQVDELHEALETERHRSLLMMEAADAAGRSIVLEVVLPKIASCVASALEVAYCGIYIADEDEGVYQPRVSVGSLPDRLRRELSEPLSFDSDRLLREVINQQKPIVLCCEQDSPVLGNKTCADFGVGGFVAIPILSHDRVPGIALAVTSEVGRTFEPSQIELAWGVIRMVAPAIDNARLYAETRRQLAESRSLQEVNAALLDEVGLEYVIDIVCREARHLSGAQNSVLYLIDEEGQVETTGSRERGQVEQDSDRPTSEPIDWGAFDERSGVPSDLEKPDVARGERERTPLVIVPLRVEKGVIGAIRCSEKPGGFCRSDVRMMSLFADQAAIAIEHARLHERQERVVILEERQRLARELHDSVTQSLYGVAMYAEAAGRQLNSGEIEPTAASLREIRDTAMEALREMRLLVFELRPPALQRDGLASAIRARLASVEGRSGLHAEFTDDGVPELSAAVEEGLHRILQEALNNALRHAEATRISVRLHANDSHIMLDVADDGVGFDPAQGRDKGGLGLRSMEERTTKLAGRLTLFTRPGEGTWINVEVPRPFASGSLPRGPIRTKTQRTGGGQ